MPAGPRIRGNNAFGITTDNPLTAGATSFNSAGLANLPVVASAHAVVTLDPLRQFGAPEIIVVTVHTAAATVATITRGAYGTTARSHPQGTTWVHAPVTEDVISIVTSSTRPSDPYAGESIFETDTGRIVDRDAGNANWVRTGWTSSTGRTGCTIRRNANQSFNSAAENFVIWDTEVFDSDGFFTPTSDTVTVPAGLGGLYLISMGWNWSAVAATRGFVQLFIGGLAYARVITTGDDQSRASWGPIPVNAGDTIKITAFQQSGGALNFSQTVLGLATFIYRIGA